MFYTFPSGTFAMATRDYERPYEDPITVRRGEVVKPVIDSSRNTDLFGWTWCIGPDGRSGWTPDSWCEPIGDGWRMMRDFSALELTIRKGDRLRVIHGESGFLFCESATGDQAWVPDAFVTLASPD